MNLLNNLRIGARLGVGFALVSIGMLLMAAFAGWQLRLVEDNLERLADTDQAQVALASAIVESTQLRAVSARNLVLLQSADAQAAELQQVLAASGRLADAFKKLQQQLQADPLASTATQQAFAGLQALEQRYGVIASEVVRLAMAGDRAAAGNKITQDCMPILVQVTAQGAALQQALSTQVHTRVAQSKAGFAASLWWLLGVGVGLTLACVVLGLTLTRSIVQPLREAVDLASAAADGDLSRQVLTSRQDECGQLLRALERMRQGLTSLVGQVRRNSDNIATGAQQIAAGNSDLSVRTESQASSLEQTAAAMEEISGTVQNTAAHASQASRLAEDSRSVAGRAGDNVQAMVATMGQIHQASRRVSDIIATIDGIAFQTNILALNAAVEAARAGEQGRGFAVVAGEVRSLAQRSAAAAREIKALIEANVAQVDQGLNQASAAGQTMAEVVEQAQKVSALVSAIGAATAEQTSGIGQVGQAVTELDRGTQQNAALVEEAAAASESLKQQAAQLVQAVSAFRLQDAALSA
ncbi:MAG: HAMP domain-containing protein [Rubrivivax sp.]|nr:HAMP domain-containing protein [Rubrivivax sp.]